jgi:hypothetical protein
VSLFIKNLSPTRLDIRGGHPSLPPEISTFKRLVASCGKRKENSNQQKFVKKAEEESEKEKGEQWTQARKTATTKLTNRVKRKGGNPETRGPSIGKILTKDQAIENSTISKNPFAALNIHTLSLSLPCHPLSLSTSHSLCLSFSDSSSVFFLQF